MIASLGGKDTPACGFGTGIERLLQVMLAQKVSLPKRQRSFVRLLSLDEDRTAFALLTAIRQAGISADMDFVHKKLSKAMQAANKDDVRYVLVLGPDEVAVNKGLLKEMKTGEQKAYDLSVIPALLEELFYGL